MIAPFVDVSGPYRSYSRQEGTEARLAGRQVRPLYVDGNGMT
jgi:hypothetical protein